MNQPRQFSLFVPHDAPVNVVPEAEPVVEEIVKESKSKVNLYSEAATKLLNNKKDNSNSTHQVAASLYSLEFNLKSCRLCGGIKLIKYNNVYVCKTCGSENTYGGVLFGDKLKKGEKV